jgi:hypothetical protein
MPSHMTLSRQTGSQAESDRARIQQDTNVESGARKDT